MRFVLGLLSCSSVFVPNLVEAALVVPDVSLLLGEGVDEVAHYGREALRQEVVGYVAVLDYVVANCCSLLLDAAAEGSHHRHHPKRMQDVFLAVLVGLTGMGHQSP